jgi:predicted alpha/beta superfamily hydrolase
MNTTKIAAIVVVVGWLGLQAGWAMAGQKIEVVVRVPGDTPATVEAIYLAGSLASVGTWRPDGVRLIRQEDGSYTGSIELETGQTLEFKITRGSWGTVEKNADGSDRANRSIVVDAGTKRIEATVERWAPQGATRPSSPSVVGTLKLHEIDSEALKRRRTIRVWLPDAYGAEPNARFDVLYMQDGQNCFDRATSAFGREWEIDETLTKLIAEKAVRPLIVVGIDNGGAERVEEYTYEKASATAPAGGGALRQRGGRGAEYARFLLTEVKPFVEKQYRVNTGQAHAFIGGSSLGGLVSLEIARRHSGTFGGVIAMSPTLRWGERALAEDLERDAGGLAHARIWVDMGTRELGDDPRAAARNEQLVAEARRLDAVLARQGVEHRLFVADGAEHNETAWAARFGQAIAYVLGGQ